MDELLTPEEASATLKISVHTLSTWRSRSRRAGPAWIEVGGSIRYQRSDLATWIASRRRGAIETAA